MQSIVLGPWGDFLFLPECISKREYLKARSFNFCFTLITTTFAGGDGFYGKFNPGSGVIFSLWKILLESLAYFDSFSRKFSDFMQLGHFFTSIYHKVKCTLLLYSRVWLGFLIVLNPIGTFWRPVDSDDSRVNSRKKFFDIGVAVHWRVLLLLLQCFCLDSWLYRGRLYLFRFILICWIQNFKAMEKTFWIFWLGNNLLFKCHGESLLADPSLLPAMSEMIHYPISLLAR